MVEKLWQTILPDQVELGAAILAKSHGLKWDEVCGFEAGLDECESGTCVAAFSEDHDARLCREQYRNDAASVLGAVFVWRAFDGEPLDSEIIGLASDGSIYRMKYAKNHRGEPAWMAHGGYSFVPGYITHFVLMPPNGDNPATDNHHKVA